ncbi:hypothetical protein ACFPYJ_11620 [Paenibacillus solisilvae]|uniref:Uncharacterized protein n=1 Tax=Paenibacillus solisilvae TaxID=2486751 RepID=A0ABW0VX41_9BACL
MRLVLLSIWILFVIYAFLLAPGERGMDDPLLGNIFTFQMDKVDPSIMMVFYLLGIYPLAFACLLLPTDDREIPA